MIIMSSFFRMMARDIGREERFEKDDRFLVVDDPRKLKYFHEHYAKKREDVLGMMCPHELMTDSEEREFKDVLKTKFTPGAVDCDMYAYQETGVPPLQKDQASSTPALGDAFKELYDIRSKAMPAALKKGLSPIYLRVNSTYPIDRHAHDGMVYSQCGRGTHGYFSEHGKEFYEMPSKHLIIFNDRWWHGAPSHLQLENLVNEPRINFVL